MLSTIKIDVDHDNQPIIVINYQQSPDIRDKLVKKFLETFNGSSLTHFGINNCTPNGSVSQIRPIAKGDYPFLLAGPIEEAARGYKIESDLNMRDFGKSKFAKHLETLYEGILKITESH